LESPAPSSDTSIDLSPYTGWSCILASWFWRFYDRLFTLILLNFGWFFSMFAVGWIAFHFNWVEAAEGFSLWKAYLLLVVESAVSVGWASAVFKLFQGGTPGVPEVWIGLKKYLWKAVLLAGVSWFIVVLAAYNIRFYFYMGKSGGLPVLFLAGFVIWMLAFWAATMLYQWPVLFFQDPPVRKVLYRSCLLAVESGWSLAVNLAAIACAAFLFTLLPFLWFFIGLTALFSLQCVVLEKALLKHKITYLDRPLEEMVGLLEKERKRNWRELLRPWEHR
jgi:hypothetical protein